jgi:putative aldouronate transport system substrate-binding protein
MRNPQGLPPAQAMARYFRSVFNGPFVQDTRYLEQYFELQAQKDALKTWLEPTDERQMPPVTPTQEESKKFASIMNDVNSKYQEIFTKVITGAEPPCRLSFGRSASTTPSRSSSPPLIATTNVDKSAASSQL